MNIGCKAIAEIVYWKNVRKEVAKVNPELSKTIDKLDPGKKYPLFKVRYPFGAKIAHEGEIYFPTQKGTVEPLSSNHIADEFRSKLKRRDLPAILMLKNTAEMFYEMPDRIISGHVLRPGFFIGLWNQFDAEEIYYVKWVWSLVSGARTIYLLPKTTNIVGHKILRKKYGMTAHTPKNYSEQWKVFVEIANSKDFGTPWYSEMLFFPDIWFETATKDPAWKNLYDYLLKEAWRDSTYWRHKNTFELIWENFIHHVMDKNVKPNLYIAYMVKQLILIGSGVLPCLTVATDDTAAPISALQKIYLNDYKLKDYLPIFMCSHCFSFTQTYPAYYSLQYPNLLETIPINQNVPSVLSSMPEIQTLIQAFRNRIAKNHIIEHTPIDSFCNHVALDYFHYREEKHNHIRSTENLPKEDVRFSSCKTNNNAIFPSASSIISGCIRFKNN